MAGEVILPNMAPADELNAAYRLQQFLIDQFNSASPAMPRTEFLAFRKDWDNRLHKVHTRINELRAIVEPVKSGEKEDGTEQAARCARKMVARKSTALDAALRNHPLRTSTPVAMTELDPLQDFTAYTEVDPNSHITVNSATQITITGWENETAYVSKDYGAGFFTNFTHLFDLQMTDHSGTAGSCVCVKTTVQDHAKANPQNAAGTWASWGFGNNNAYAIYLQHFINGVSQALDNTTGLVVSTFYYCTESRVGSTLTLKIYADADRTNLIDTLTIDDDGTARRYVMPVATASNAQAESVSYIVYNLDLQLPSTARPFYFQRFVLGRRN